MIVYEIILYICFILISFAIGAIHGYHLCQKDNSKNN